MASDNRRNAWQLTKAQRELVNNCFEEHQYETAIATLDQLRTSEFNPWPPHIRQLIYISLQSTENYSAQDEIDTSVQTSPSKIIKQHQSQLSMNFIPTKAVFDAQKVLMAYLHTSLPGALSCALPRRRSLPDPAVDHDETESAVARRALYIMQSQDCWELLSKEFTSRQNALPLIPKSKSKTRRQSERLGYVKLDTSQETGPPIAVQENAWPLLDWLVSLFEHDERTPTMTVPCSPLLADQLIDHDGKPHLESPIAIILLCLQQTQLQRRRLAGRLLSLVCKCVQYKSANVHCLQVVNLTSTAELELNTLAVAMYTRVSSLSQLSLLLSQLGHSTNVQVLKFKIGICQVAIGGLGLPTAGNAPKPQPRIRPRAKKTLDSDNRDLSTESHPAAKSSIPSMLEVLRLVQTPTPESVSEDGSLTPLWCKSQLLLAYGTLQIRLGPRERDPQWLKTVTETLPRITREVFEQKGTEASMYQRLLESQIVGWRQALDEGV